MQRRTLLGFGLAGAALLATAGAGLALIKPGLADGRLTAAGRAVFAALAPAVLNGSLTPGDAALHSLLDRIDRTIEGLPPAMQSELAQLLAVLLAPPGRVALAGLRADWSEAPLDALQEALSTMRHSSLELRQQTYHALRDLISAAWFADPATWAALRYPGPQPV